MVLLALLLAGFPQPPPAGAPALAPGRHTGLTVDREAWYRVDASGFHRITAQFTHTAGDVDLYVRTAEGRLVARSEGSGDTETVVARIEAGTHAQLVVHGSSPTTASLTIEPADVTTLDEGRHESLEVGGRAAFYVPVGGPVRIRAQFSNREGDVDLFLNGGDLGSSEGMGDEEEIVANLPEGGAMLEAVIHPGRSSPRAVRVAIEVRREGFPEFADPEARGGATRESATDLRPGAYTVDVDREAWFRVDASAGLKAAVEFRHSLGDVDLDVIARGRTAWSAGRGDREVVAAVADGPTYVRLYITGGGRNRCRLTVTSTEPAFLRPGVQEDVEVDGQEVFRVAGPGRAVITASFDGRAGDVDLRLTGPRGEALGSSLGLHDEERLEIDLPDGASALLLWVEDGGRNTVRLSYEGPEPPRN